MSDFTKKKPAEGEFSEYHRHYIDLVPTGCILETMQRQQTQINQFFSGLSEEKALYRYAEGKWSIKEILGHLNDGERVFAYRALRIARNDTAPLPGFDQDLFVLHGHFDGRSMNDLLLEFNHARESTVDLFRSLTEDAWDRRGIANNNPVSVRAIAWILCGHVFHHEEVIKTKYTL